MTVTEPVLLDLPVDDPALLGHDDVEACMDLLDQRGAWLHDVKGITDQWPRSMRQPKGGSADRTFDRAGQLRQAVDRWTLWGIREVTGRVVACTIVDTYGDSDYIPHYPPTAVCLDTGIAFAEPRTFYVHRMATAVDCGGYGLGSRLLNRAAEVARQNAGVYLRLECSRHNEGLKRYYVEQGFRQVNDVEVPGRFSGALFSKVVDHERLRFNLSTKHRKALGL